MRLGLITGIHEDIVRLRKAFEILDVHRCDAIACLGDIVGYSVPYFSFLKSRDAHAVIALIQDRCQYVIAGNHDLYAVQKLPTLQRTFAYPPDWYELDWPTRKAVAAESVWLYDDELPAMLAIDDREFLLTLPEMMTVDVGGDLRVLLTHYAYPDISGDSKTSDPSRPEQLEQHLVFMAEHGCDLGISGHQGHDGVVVSTVRERRSIGFGVFRLPVDQPTWMQIPWVANGTHSNGVAILDSGSRHVEAIPLRTPRHVVPGWAER